jgi:Flp pilus assembly protein TadG
MNGLAAASHARDPLYERTPVMLTRARSNRRGTAAMEFAMVAPIMVTMVWGVYDVARALVAWEETCRAAEAVAQAAEKMSITNRVYPNGNSKAGEPISALTATQMQAAMSSIYAQMPWLNLGAGNGSLNGGYSVTLSGVAFTPLCAANSANTCQPQAPNVLWSSYLTEGGAQLLTPAKAGISLYRACGPLLPVAQFPNNSTQLLYMIDANLVNNGVQNLNLIPQVVADVQYQFTPTFPLLSGKTFTFWASASFPAPLGGDDQEIVFDKTNSGGVDGTVEDCAGGGAV